MIAEEFKYEIAEYLAGTVLEVCPGSKSFPHLFKVGTPGIDESPDIRVEDAGDLSLIVEDSSCDALVIRTPLAALKDYRASLRDWWRCVKDGGFLVVQLTHEGTKAKHVIDALRDAGRGWDIVRRERPDEAGPGLLVFKKTGERHAHSWKDAKKKTPRKSVCICRFGGFGDMIQTAALFPELKRAGLHITVMTTPKGKDIIRDDPNVDSWFLLETDQVPNLELGPFWKCIAKRYTKFINLCESVEGTLLAMPGRAAYYWPKQARHSMMNRNYGEFAAEIAEIPFRPEGRFYATAEEEEAARALIGGRKSVVFTLSGSSRHKVYPHQDVVIKALSDFFGDEIRIFLTGDAACQILEYGWEDKPNVVCLSGKQGIRETLALAQVADALIGPETGVMNAVAYDPSLKVCLLSHSTHENLTKHWVNCVPLEPEASIACYPCHKLHYGMAHCQEDERTGCAMCQISIHPGRVIEPVIAYLEKLRESD